MIGEFGTYGTVWFNPRAIANILSLKRVRQKYAVAYKVKADGSAKFVVTCPNGMTIDFVESLSRLYYHDTAEVQGVVMAISTV
jgi:hypothetical protein